MFSSIRSATLLGIQGTPISVEVHIGSGLPGFTVVGLPDEACREARDRVRAALLSSGAEWPNKKITVNLAPSSQRKGGVGLDLALAMGILSASGQMSSDNLAEYSFVAELGLDGSLRPVPGAAPLVAGLRETRVVVALPNAREAKVASPRSIHCAATLRDVVLALRGDGEWLDTSSQENVQGSSHIADMSDVRGQPTARLAAEIAAAGGHHILFVGSPGAGKTMIAERLPGLLPPLTNEEAVTATMIHSAAGASLPPGGLITYPPFRAPHHSASMIAMVGGGSSVLRPGEASLAHSGVLFLDEVGEFMPSVLDALRQPLEEGEVRIARASAGITLPARFLLVGATNPCPCGGGAPGACVCNETARSKYLRRLSGPFLDRFDLRVAVAMTGVEELLDVREGEPSAAVQERVARVREMSLHRSGGVNARLSAQELDSYAPLSPAARDVLRRELELGRLTGRGYHRIRRVARTLADLAGNEGEIAHETVRVALLMRTRLHEREVA